MGGECRRVHAVYGAESFRSSPTRRLRGWLPGGLDLVELAPQALDLVAQLRGVLESQLVRRQEHLLLELDHGPRDLLRAHGLDIRALSPPAALRDLGLEREEI